MSCASSIPGGNQNNNNDDDTVQEEIQTPDQALREQTAGSYLIDCYDSGGGSYHKHFVTLTSGDVTGGTYTHTDMVYLDEACTERLYGLTVESLFNYGAVSSIDRDEAFSDDITLEGVLVEAPRMNITVNSTSIIAYAPAVIPDLETYFGIVIPGIETEVDIPGEVVTYYTHAYFPNGDARVTIATFNPDATDYRATFDVHGAVTAVKQ